MSEKNNNPLMCDPVSGICEIPASQSGAQTEPGTKLSKPIRIIYFTDPICSACWGIEPQLRKLKLEYGHLIEIEYRMGGLLPDWSYNNDGINKPSDVAHHWDEVSKYYDMPIDGDVWLEDPLSSSYPPSIAFKAAQIQDEEKSILFLRRVREMVFLEKKNISEWEYLNQAAVKTGLDTGKLKTDYEGRARSLFLADLEFTRKSGVGGFPTLIFTDGLKSHYSIYGFKPYKAFEEIVLSLFPDATKNDYDQSWLGLFKQYPTLTTWEFSELSNSSPSESEALLKKLYEEGRVDKFSTRNGNLWINK